MWQLPSLCSSGLQGLGALPGAWLGGCERDDTPQRRAMEQVRNLPVLLDKFGSRQRDVQAVQSESSPGLEPDSTGRLLRKMQQRRSSRD